MINKNIGCFFFHDPLNIYAFMLETFYMYVYTQDIYNV